MPSDIIGGEVLDVDPDTGQRCLRFVDGPIFTNILLVDEINRTLPRTQSALLEAMQECAVTVGGRTKPIAPPFFVVATQNPIEQEGTYPLPEAQLDRFMYTLPVNYPSVEQEEEIATATTSDTVYTPRAICSRAELLQFQDLIRQIPVSPHVVKFAVSLARASRPDSPKPHPLIRRYAQWGAGPRASQYMILGAKALAVMQGKPTPTANDVRRIAPLVLQHRIVVNYAAVADDVTSADLAKAVLDGVPEPAYAKRL
jgi:MoxR-like ATPase